MTEPDFTEVRELRTLLQGAQEDQRELKRKLQLALDRIRALEGDLEQVTAHRNRLIDEREQVWGRVLAPAAPAKPDATELRAEGNGDDQC